MRKVYRCVRAILLCLGLLLGMNNHSVLFAEDACAAVENNVGVAAGESMADALSEFSGEVAKLKASEQRTDYIPVEEQEPGEEKERMFQTARLIVKSSVRIRDGLAESIAGPFQDIYIIQYKDESDAARAYHFYQKQSAVAFVQADQVHAQELCTEERKRETMDKNEGIRMCGFSGIQQKILEKYGNIDAVPKVTVAVMDTGIAYEHELFEGRISDLGYNAAADLWRRWLNARPEDDYGHGTAVSGVIAMCTPEYVDILPVKISKLGPVEKDGRRRREPTLDDSDIYMGVEYAIANGADVINMSFGGYGKSRITTEYLNDCQQAGIPVVSAYGNEASRTEEVYPACYGEVVGVSAVNNDKSFASAYSNYGGYVDVAAPGTDVYTADYRGGYCTMTGTSLATPYVSAAAALCRALLPEADVTALSCFLFGNARDLGKSGWDPYYGYGLVDLSDCKMILMSQTEKNEESVTEQKATESVEKKQVKTGLSAPVIKKIKTFKKGVKITWKKVSGAAGYQIVRSRNKAFTKGVKKIKTRTKRRVTMNLAKNKRYYFRVRAFQKADGKTCFGSWSKIKKAKITGKKS